MRPDARLRYGLLMLALGAISVFGPPVATMWSATIRQTAREWRRLFEVIFFGGLVVFYAGAYVVSLALDPRSVARRSHEHHKQVT